MTTRTAAFVIAALLAASLIASGALYSELPARIPTHWNVDGAADGWSAKPAGAFTLPGVIALMLLFVVLGDWLSPARFKIARFRPTYNLLFVIVAALMAYIHAIMLAAALSTRPDFGRWLVSGILIAIGFLSSLLGKTQRNFWVGIRTPWTLASDAVWIRTHRFAAKLLSAVSAIAAALAIAGVPLAICFALLMAGLAATVVHSFVVSKRLEAEGR
jgi:uncharacterized membrane protein